MLDTVGWLLHNWRYGGGVDHKRHYVQSILVSGLPFPNAGMTILGTTTFHRHSCDGDNDFVSDVGGDGDEKEEEEEGDQWKQYSRFLWWVHVIVECIDQIYSSLISQMFAIKLRL